MIIFTTLKIMQKIETLINKIIKHIRTTLCIAHTAFL